jgi:periplasmic glucans biosynthesis protein
LQRQRDFRIYEDLEAHYERRPSLWIEPIGDWGDGQVDLIEIPSKEEIHDNIVAFWRPREPLREKGEYQFTYRMHWGAESPRPIPLAQVITTRVGAGPRLDTRLFVLDLAGDTLKNLDASSGNIRGVVSAGTGKLDNISLNPIQKPAAGGSVSS